MKIISNMKNLIYNSYNILQSKRFFIMKTDKYKENINKLYFFIQRINDTYDSSSITLNPYQSSVMNIQRRVWEIEKYEAMYLKKRETLYQIVDFFIAQKKSTQSKIMNSILFIIALLSTVDIAYTIYNIILTGDFAKMIFGVGPSFVIILVIFLYNRFAGN